MAEEFREGPAARQNDGASGPSADGDGSGRALPRRDGGRLALAVALLTLAVAAVAWFRWERPRELSPGVPIPRYGRLEPGAGLEPPPGDGCRVILRVPGAPVDALAAWAESLLSRGWLALGEEQGEGGRTSYLRDGVRLRVGTDPAEDGRSTRLRITYRPCPEALVRSGDPRVAVAGSRGR